MRSRAAFSYSLLTSFFYYDIIQSERIFYKSNEVLSLATYAVFTGRNPILIRFLLENGDSVDSDSTYYGISLYDWCHYDENKTILVTAIGFFR